ncbi:P-loop containing nucleoside triphosphate hydrolase protein [Gloeopeniophorella convolvens]|nr:P-loop containing nucleoside triphosphate hydrolase protein [Gloeopeniophorella convolvens]
MSNGQSLVREYRLCLLGPGGVGKSALVRRFTLNWFADEYDPTIEDSWRQQYVIDGEVALVEVYDITIQEGYTGVLLPWFREYEAFLLVYSVRNRWSFDRATTTHEQILRIKGEEAVPIVLVGNKHDSPYEREVTMDVGCAEQKAARVRANSVALSSRHPRRRAPMCRRRSSSLCA